MNIGDYIKKYRLDHALSMGDFAKMVGLSKAYVSILERNYNPTTKRAAVPSLDTIRSVAKVTGIDFNELVSMLDQEVDIVDISKFTGNEQYTATEDDIKRVLFRGRQDTTDEMYEEVLNYADYVVWREDMKKNRPNLHVIKKAGRDGSMEELYLTDEDLERFNKWKSGLDRPGDEI